MIASPARSNTASLRRLVAAAGVCSAIAAMWPGAAGTAPRSPPLDLGFGTEGRVLTDFGGRDDTATSMHVRRDGRILVAGSSSPAGRWWEAATAVARYRPTGRPDPGFAQHGMLLTGRSGAKAIVVDDAGRIVTVGGTWPSDSSLSGGFEVARFLSDGMPDRAFGNGLGRVKLAAATLKPRIGGCGHVSTAVDVQSDGKLIVVGGLGCADDEHAPEYVVVLRLTPSGTLDPSFSRDGQLSVRERRGDSCVAGVDVTVQPDDRIVVTEEDGLCDADTRVFRFTRDGMLDQSFGRDGVASVPASSHTDLTVDDAGRLLLTGAGGADVFARRRPVVVRLTPAGELDNSLDRDGVKVLRFEGVEAEGSAVVLLPDGRFVVAGTTHALGQHPNSLRTFIAIHRNNGALDRRATRRGVRFFNPGPMPTVADAALDARKRLTIAGSVDMPAPTGSDFYLARFRVPGNKSRLRDAPIGSTRRRATSTM